MVHLGLRSSRSSGPCDQLNINQGVIQGVEQHGRDRASSRKQILDRGLRREGYDATFFGRLAGSFWFREEVVLKSRSERS